MQATKLGLNLNLKSGHPTLEFTNTVNNHASSKPGETLFEYEHLLDWAKRVGLLNQDQAQVLMNKASRQADEATVVFTQSIELREAIYRIFLALTKGKSPRDFDLAVLNNILTRVTDGACLVRQAGHFEWQWNLNEGALELPLRLIVLSAVDLLTSDYCQRVGQCADEDGCGWLFVDTTKNHSRRWCDINDCGNRAKQRRYQKRVRKARTLD